MKEIKCKICGSLDNLEEWTEETAKEMKKQKLCFSCWFWNEQHTLDLNERGEHNYAIINSRHYVLAPHTDGYFKGFGGTNFKIKFHDGYETECDNLWCQGEVPVGYWRNLMPDNAEFIY